MFLRFRAVFRLWPTALSALVLAAAAVAALQPSLDDQHSAPPRQILSVAAEPPLGLEIVLVLVDGPAQAASVATSRSPGKDVIVVDASLSGEAAIAETLREVAQLGVPFELVDLRSH